MNKLTAWNKKTNTYIYQKFHELIYQKVANNRFGRFSYLYLQDMSWWDWVCFSLFIQINPHLLLFTPNSLSKIITTCEPFMPFYTNYYWDKPFEPITVALSYRQQHHHDNITWLLNHLLSMTAVLNDECISSIVFLQLRWKIIMLCWIFLTTILNISIY